MACASSVIVYSRTRTFSSPKDRRRLCIVASTTDSLGDGRVKATMPKLIGRGNCTEVAYAPKSSSRETKLRTMPSCAGTTVSAPTVAQKKCNLRPSKIFGSGSFKNTVGCSTFEFCRNLRISETQNLAEARFCSFFKVEEVKTYSSTTSFTSTPY